VFIVKLLIDNDFNKKQNDYQEYLPKII